MYNFNAVKILSLSRTMDSTDIIFFKGNSRKVAQQDKGMTGDIWWHQPWSHIQKCPQPLPKPEADSDIIKVASSVSFARVDINTDFDSQGNQAPFVCTQSNQGRHEDTGRKQASCQTRQEQSLPSTVGPSTSSSSLSFEGNPPTVPIAGFEQGQEQQRRKNFTRTLNAVACHLKDDSPSRPPTTHAHKVVLKWV